METTPTLRSAIFTPDSGGTPAAVLDAVLATAGVVMEPRPVLVRFFMVIPPLNKQD
jgi:hypothetical protein